jgi:prolyl-tRNA synthetase
VIAAVEQLVAELEAAGVEVLLDDRPERPGVKFKDADLIGMPLRLNVGTRGLASGTVELKPRTQTDAKQVEHIPLRDVVRTVTQRIQAAR